MMFGGGGMMMGAAKAGAGALAAAGFDDSNKNSLISDIKNYFTKSVRPGGMIPGGAGGPGGQGGSGKDTSLILQ